GAGAAQGVEVLVPAVPDRHVAVEGVVGGGLVGEHVGRGAAANQGRQHLGGVAEQADRKRVARVLGLAQPGQGLVEVVGGAVEVAGVAAALGGGRVLLRRSAGGAVHGGGQRLGAAHAAQAGGDDQPACERAAEVATAAGGEGLVSALQDALSADVDPAAGRHLA